MSNVRGEFIGNTTSIGDDSVRPPAGRAGATDCGAGTDAGDEEENDADTAGRCSAAASKSRGGIGGASGIRFGGIIASGGGISVDAASGPPIRVGWEVAAVCVGPGNTGRATASGARNGVTDDTAVSGTRTGSLVIAVGAGARNGATHDIAGSGDVAVTAGSGAQTGALTVATGSGAFSATTGSKARTGAAGAATGSGAPTGALAAAKNRGRRNGSVLAGSCGALNGARSDAMGSEATSAAAGGSAAVEVSACSRG
jgi:hypothetical protein